MLNLTKLYNLALLKAHVKCSKLLCANFNISNRNFLEKRAKELTFCCLSRTANLFRATHTAAIPAERLPSETIIEHFYLYNIVGSNEVEINSV